VVQTAIYIFFFSVKLSWKCSGLFGCLCAD